MKVFISQPMNGKTEEEILAERADAFALIKSLIPDAELIDTFIGDQIAENHSGLKYLAKSIEMLDEAEDIWMMPGWKAARGCRIEHDCAKAYSIPIHYLYFNR